MVYINRSARLARVVWLDSRCSGHEPAQGRKVVLVHLGRFGNGNLVEIDHERGPLGRVSAWTYQDRRRNERECTPVFFHHLTERLDREFLQRAAGGKRHCIRKVLVDVLEW